MSRPRLLIITSARNLGGGEIYLKNLLPTLENDYDVTVLGPRFARDFFAADTKTLWLPLFPAFLDKTLHRTHQLKKIYYKLFFSLLLRLDNYDLVNVQWFDGELIEGINKRPLVLTLQTGFLIPRQYDGYVVKVLNGLDKIICVSQHAKEQVVERGLSSKECVVIYNGLNPNTFKVNTRPGRYITWVGRVEEADKNPRLFLEIAKLADRNKLPYQFRIVGDGSYLPVIKNDLPENLEICGHVPPTNMAGIYNEASLLCMTSTSEGLPFVAVEAMASGVPVVATAVGGLNELLADDAGILIDDFRPESFLMAFESVINSEDLYRSITVHARKKIEHEFSLASMAEQTKAIYSAVISGAER